MTERFETIQLHGGQTPDPTTGSRAVPIYQTTSYVFEDADQAAARFSLSENGNIYTRITNPTTAVLEERLALLEGGVGALATASGSAAITYAILNLAQAGDHIVSAASIYGGTYNLFAHTLPDFGITTSFVDSEDLAALKAAIQENTKAVFLESLGNPDIDIADFKKIAAIAHEAGIPSSLTIPLRLPICFEDLSMGRTSSFIPRQNTSVVTALLWEGPLSTAATLIGQMANFPSWSIPIIATMESHG